ncbi:cation acetate symporter [Brevibacillus sp. SYP-B805]|uniref:solute symporter family protein n=1 Tax=Brevibacillus sp. SYP-B805 TaxID=1578199 RepID=UPI0013EA802B|nr:cation acetate symporter [Brevibacillus sp. SYP-B805]NGQ97464.1 cation acetate symporter [Brevibacillus sp. SYP-B805]
MNVTTIIFFLAVVVGTLAITYSAAKRTVNARDFYAAGHRLTGLQNGWAIAGDYMSAASFLGITGTIAMYGFDGFFYAIGFLVSYLVMLYLVAEPLHNLGTYTLADAIAVRFDSPLLRGVIALNTLTITIFYMIAQLVGAGALIHLLLDIDYASAVMIVGGLMTIYVVFGGMVATSWVQIIKAILLLASTLLVSLIVLSRFHWNLLEMFAAVKAHSPLGERFLEPGNEFVNPLETISLHLALIFGTAGLPHIVARFFTVKDAVTTRRSVVTATWVVGSFYLMTIFLGFGASVFVGWEQIRMGENGGNLSVPLLAYALGGDFLMAYLTAVAFATILAVVTGLVMSASSAFAHDLYANVLRRGMASENEQVTAAQCSSIGVGVISIVLAIGAQNMNVAILVSLTFAMAASANLPLILLTLYWRRFTTTGALAGIFTGLLSSVILVMLGPYVMNPVDGLIRADTMFPLANPGIVSIPLGFLGAVLGTLLSREPGGCARYEQMLLRAHTGGRS